MTGASGTTSLAAIAAANRGRVATGVRDPLRADDQLPLTEQLRHPVGPGAGLPHLVEQLPGRAVLEPEICAAVSTESGPTSKKPLVSIVVPVFNESEAIPIFLAELSDHASGSDFSFEFVFVDDGSTDSTLALLVQLRRRDSRLRIVELSRNFGKEAALSAGLDASRGDAVIPIDVDLQDPPSLIPEMLSKWQSGFDVVQCRRSCRASDSFAKRTSAKLFYRINNKMSSTEIPEDVGDFRLMDRAVVDAVAALPESSRFMKGIFAWVGFRTATIDYVRAPRAAGTSKLPFWGLWNLAIESITSFSTVPLRIWTYVGFSVSAAALGFGALVVGLAIFNSVSVPGYASLMVAVTFLGGLQLVGIGVVGEYLGRTYLEAKRRPVYVVRKTYED